MESIKKVILSRIWVNNEYLIGVLWKKLIELNMEIPSEFWVITMQDGNAQLVLPQINRDTLQILVESGLWENDSRIMNFILDHYGRLSTIERRDFGTPEFWGHVFGHEEEDQWGSGRSLDQFYNVGEMVHQHVRRFNAEAMGYNIRFRHTNEIDGERLRQILNHLLHNILADRNNRDRIGVEINHRSLDKRVLVPFTDCEFINADRILNVVERVQQSNQEFAFNEEMNFKIIIVNHIEGRGGRNRYEGATNRIINWNEWFKKHCGNGGCFLQINNQDNLCLARAVVTGRAITDNHPQLQTIKKGDKDRRTLQQEMAKKLMDEIGLTDFNGPCGMNEVKQIQQYLAPNYQIKIFSKDHYNALIYQGEEAPKIIHLYYHDEHFDVITKMPAFMSRVYFCERCNIGYSNKEDHKCNHDNCPGCNAAQKCQFQSWIKCDDCNRWLISRSCFENHKLDKVDMGNGKTKKIDPTCYKIKRCKTCNQLVDSRHQKRHKCFQMHCKTCNERVDKEDHVCYMKVINDELKQKRRPIFIFFDFETRQDVILGQNEHGNIMKHVPNCCVAYRVCDVCRNKDLGTCTNCGGENRHVFLGDNCLNDFGKWLFSTENRGATALAHNAKAFDSQFMLEYLHEQKTIKPTVVMKGLEILMLEAGAMRIIDTFNFLPMALSKLPKTFNEPELKKGYFPHFFNSNENWHYVGQLPDPEFYGPDNMSDEARMEFLKWHGKERALDKLFNLQNELLEYCESDVHILTKCALKFRDIFIKETGVDPFLTSLTIASACNYVFRKNFLKPETIGIVPHGGYNRNENQSIIALKWLKWISKIENIRIRHKLNGGEVKIGNYKVDGLSDKTIYEFHGCLWHGCPRCMKKRTDVTLNQNKSAEEAYQATIDRRKYLENAGYTVIEKWECDLTKELKANKEMKAFFDSIKLKEPLGPRDAFFGGRTNAIKLYHKCGPGEKIKYVDVCSLYPYICKMGIFPIKHPEIITENFANLDSHPYMGIIKCTVLPPKDLYHPVLTYRCNGKLMFPLCKTCADLELDECDHTDEQRAISGTWVSLELYKAMEKGYKVISIDEVWHYTQTEKYDAELKMGGLFADYINTFLRLKQQADGWPQENMTDKEKDDYIANYDKHEGIKLVKEQIEKNPGMRALAKLMLNSFWGKFGQRNNLSHTEYFTEPKDFMDLVFSEKINIPSVRFFGDSLACVTYTVEDEYLEALKNTNPVIASFVTAQARLKLYSYIEKLGRRVLYFDTDSIIYISSPMDNYEVPTGCYLGEMTDELKGYGEGSYIDEFVAGGPKNYGYRVYSKDGQMIGEHNKVRGIRLTFSTKKTVNFDSLKKMVFAYCLHKNTIVKSIIEKRILRDHERNVFSKDCKKDYRIVYNKRVLLDNFVTLPYGHCETLL